MKRTIEEQLMQWKNRSSRKPLLVHGIRQVGKTWILKDFGEREFENIVYINFDMEPSLKELFVRSKNPKTILFELSLLKGKKIEPSSTFIFFDEIQECNEALNALKYFDEADEAYYIAGAGSYLGITLSKGASFPVGKVEMLNMYPMTYKEFLVASGEEMLVDYMESVNELTPISEPIMDKMNQYLKKYYIVGGMPEAVKIWLESEDVHKGSQVQRNILNAYYRDFSKYPSAGMVPKIVGIWDSMVGQLSKENRKFKYSEITKNSRAREYEGALEWLVAGKYLNKVHTVKKLETPLKAYSDDARFKLYFPDTGLLREMAGYVIDMDSNNQFMGAIAENFVLQELIAIDEKEVHYWADKQYEMDFVISNGGSIIPIEVKAGVNVRSASMKKLMERLPVGVRFSMKNLMWNGQIINIPLVMVGEMRRFLSDLRE